MRGPSRTAYNYRQRSGTVGSGIRYNEDYTEEEAEDAIRKGPWKAEEDEVLINHVNKHGPREWSSIRSRGLLRRTGKSCRLRWVNKLRPNLKNGCKFSMEEERLVIEMQGQIGNKWARIATYLPGRTDNDVKNFWSSRQKRLARMRQASSSSTPPPPSDHPPQQITNSLEVVPEYVEEVMGDGDSLLPPCMLFNNKQPQSTLSDHSSFSAYISHEPENIRMVELPGLMNINYDNNIAEEEAYNQEMMMTMMTTTGRSNGNLSPDDGIIFGCERQVDELIDPFPLHVQPIRSQPVDEGEMIMNEDFLVAQQPGLFVDMFEQAGGNSDELDLVVGGVDEGFFCNADQRELMFGPDHHQAIAGHDQGGEGEGGGLSCNNAVHGINGSDLKNPDMLFDDFPSDVFDQMENLDPIDSLPSPSKW